MEHRGITDIAAGGPFSVVLTGNKVYPMSKRENEILNLYWGWGVKQTMVQYTHVDMELSALART